MGRLIPSMWGGCSGDGPSAGVGRAPRHSESPSWHRPPEDEVVPGLGGAVAGDQHLANSRIEPERGQGGR
jgi:hypothetical protein